MADQQVPLPSHVRIGFRENHATTGNVVEVFWHGAPVKRYDYGPIGWRVRRAKRFAAKLARLKGVSR